MTIAIKKKGVSGRKINPNDPYAVAKRMGETMPVSRAAMTPEDARKFLAKLSMYDKNGRLIK